MNLTVLFSYFPTLVVYILAFIFVDIPAVFYLQFAILLACICGWFFLSLRSRGQSTMMKDIGKGLLYASLTFILLGLVSVTWFLMTS